MTRRFTKSDETSSIFWEITIRGRTVAVRYGRIDTDGQTRTRTHATPAEAKVAAEKQVEKKVRQGYREVAPSHTMPKASPAASRKAPARKAARKSATTRVAVPEFTSVMIGTQMWMAENLNVDRFRNGDVIAEAKSDRDWELAGENGEPAWCYYENKEVNGGKYGKLYNWHAVNDERGLAPTGWRIPSPDDWIVLHKCNPDEGQFARSIVDVSAWGDRLEGAFNTTGFSALPAGQRFFNTLLSAQFPLLMFYGNGSSTGAGIGLLSSWWTSVAKNSDEALLFSITNTDGRSFGKEFFFRKGYYLKSGGFSVRCIADRATSETDFQRMVQAYKNGDFETVAELIAQGNPPLQMNMDDSVIEDELISVCAAPKVDLSLLKRIIKRGDNLNARNVDSDQYSAVHFCAWAIIGVDEVASKVEALALLLDNGASPDIVGGDGRTALHLAAANGNAKAVELLLAASVEVNRQIPNDRSSTWHSEGGSTAIRDALVNQHWDVVERLIAHGADISHLTEPCTHSVEGTSDLFAVIRVFNRHGVYSRGEFDEAKLSRLEEEAKLLKPNR